MRRGFLEKLFTHPEQAYILDSDSPFQTVWRLWSMKESAYKIHNRLSGERSFAPTRFECRSENALEGWVFHGNEAFLTRTAITTHYIYTVAHKEKAGLAGHLSSCFALPRSCAPDHFTFIEKELINRYAEFSGMPPTALRLQKDGRGIPFLSCADHRRQIPVSITHHGNFAAFTFN